MKFLKKIMGLKIFFFLMISVMGGALSFAMEEGASQLTDSGKIPLKLRNSNHVLCVNNPKEKSFTALFDTADRWGVKLLETVGKQGSEKFHVVTAAAQGFELSTFPLGTIDMSCKVTGVGNTSIEMKVMLFQFFGESPSTAPAQIGKGILKFVTLNDENKPISIFKASEDTKRPNKMRIKDCRNKKEQEDGVLLKTTFAKQKDVNCNGDISGRKIFEEFIEGARTQIKIQDTSLTRKTTHFECFESLNFYEPLHSGDDYSIYGKISKDEGEKDDKSFTCVVQMFKETIDDTQSLIKGPLIADATIALDWSRQKKAVQENKNLEENTKEWPRGQAQLPRTHKKWAKKPNSASKQNKGKRNQRKRQRQAQREKGKK